MRALTRVVICIGILALAPAMFADVTDFVYSVNGTSYCPAMSTVACSNFGGLAAVSGLTSSLDLSAGGTGLGSLTLTYNPGPGTYHVDFWLFEQLQQPGWNEYGAVSGSPGAGQSWQIDVPDYDYNSTDPNFGGLPGGAGTVVANTLANTLGNTNYVTGGTDQYDLSCTGLSTCNDYASMAMGFNFSLAAGETGTITFNVSKTKPASGFYLEQIHPVDGANTTETDYFLTGSVTTGTGGPPPPPPTVPEPGSAILLGIPVALLLLPAGRRRLRKWVA